MPFKEFEFPGGAEDVVLTGTIIWPNAPKPNAACIFIDGSTAHDRVQKILSHRTFLHFCMKLVDKGYAVLRFDSRGTGKSTGNAMTSTFDDGVADIKAAVEALRRLSGIDSRRIFLIGHSDGGLLAANVGLHTPLAGVVTLACPGCPIDVFLLEHTAASARASGANEQQIAHQRSMDSAIYRIILSPLEDSDARAEAIKVITTHLQTWPHLLPTTYKNLKETAFKMAENLVEAPFRSFLRQNPSDVIRRLPCPVLALYGENDTQVTLDLNFGPVQEAIAASAIPLSKAMVLGGLDHFFLDAQSGLVYEGRPVGNPTHSRTLELVANWLNSIGRYAS